MFLIKKMIYLKDKEEKEAKDWMKEATEVAKKAICLKARCGTVIVKDGEIIGRGYNAPPLDDIKNRTCLDEFKTFRKLDFDRTCCMHAEWRAIIDALKNHPDKIVGSSLYFSRVGEDGEIKKSGKPYCTVCSRLALDTGVSHFLLWQEEGIADYPTDEYNKLSYDFHKVI
jgi:deoxycytidylate deaminase